MKYSIHKLVPVVSMLTCFKHLSTWPVRAGSTAEVGYSANDEGEEDNIADDNTCNSSAAHTTV